MPPADPAMLDAAALWVARTRDPAFDGWDAFAEWLEAEPRHNDAYEAALDAHDAAEKLPRAAASSPVTRRAWRPVWAGAAAAALVAALAVPQLLPRSDPYAIVTAPGEQRNVRLPDGTQIALNGDTHLRLDRAAPRDVALDHGEARFAVVHDAARPFTLEVGGSRIEDVGTIFNVRRDADGTDVTVAEGSVVYHPGGASTALAAGASLHDPGGGAAIRVGRVDPVAVGAWHAGRLVYRAAPLATVAADLARARGERVTVTAGAAMLPFTGTIMFRGVPAATIYPRLAALTGTRAVRQGTGWKLTTGRGASR